MLRAAGSSQRGIGNSLKCVDDGRKNFAELSAVCVHLVVANEQVFVREHVSETVEAAEFFVEPRRNYASGAGVLDHSFVVVAHYIEARRKIVVKQVDDALCGEKEKPLDGELPYAICAVLVLVFVGD